MSEISRIVFSGLAEGLGLSDVAPEWVRQGPYKLATALDNVLNAVVLRAVNYTATYLLLLSGDQILDVTFSSRAGATTPGYYMGVSGAGTNKRSYKFVTAGGGAWELYESYTQLAVIADSWADGQTRRCRLEWVGGVLTMSVWDGNGTLIGTQEVTGRTSGGDYLFFGSTSTVSGDQLVAVRELGVYDSASAADPEVHTLSGESLAQAGAEGAIAKSVRLAGEATAVAGTEPGVRKSARLSGEAAAQAGAICAIRKSVVLSGEALAQAGAEGSLIKTEDGAPLPEVHALSGEALAQAGAEGAIAKAVRLAGEATAVAGTESGVRKSVRLSGDAGARAGAICAIRKSVVLSGEALAQAGAEGSLRRLDVSPVPYEITCAASRVVSVEVRAGRAVEIAVSA